MSDFEQIELSAAVRAIREQLVLASVAGAGEAIRFEVGPIDMEFTVELTREAGAKGGVRAWVVNAEADARATRGSTHKVSFRLTPKDAATGRDLEIGDADPGGTSRF